MKGKARSGGRGDTYERLLRQERLILDVTEALTEALDNSGMTRAELAERLGRTPGFVSQVLGGGRNLTLRTIADIAAALSHRPSFALTVDHEAVSGSADTPELEPGSTFARFGENCGRRVIVRRNFGG